MGSYSNSSASTADRPGLAVWSPHSRACTGNFVFWNTSETQSAVDVVPTLLLREAAVDYRHNSIRDFRIKHHLCEVPFRRVTLQISVARGLKAVQPISAIKRDNYDSVFPFAYLAVNGKAMPAHGWRTESEYIQGDPDCVNKCWRAGTDKVSVPALQLSGTALAAPDKNGRLY